MGSPPCGIIAESLLNDSHVYSVPHAPVIVQVAQDAQTQKYNFQRVPAEINGTLHDDDWPENCRLSSRFVEETLSVSPRYFVDGKAEKPLVNDQAPPIYLAILLWTQVFPEMALANDKSEFQVTSTELASALRERYGRGKKADVEDALALLREAGLANRPGGGAHWRIRYRKLRLLHGQQLVDEVAKRTCATRIAKPREQQLSLLPEE